VIMGVAAGTVVLVLCLPVGVVMVRVRLGHFATSARAWW
jgi:hypothetical protein